MNLIERVARRWILRLARASLDTEVIYVGVFLDKMSKQRLLRAFPAVHPTVWAHHLTVWHFKNGTPRPELPWGKTVDLKVVGHFVGERAQAVVVAPPTALRPEGRTPHITISTAAGATPAESNALLSREMEPVRGLPAVKGRVGWVDSREQVHFEAPPRS